jgi:short-subunit dehydrogenase
MTNLANDFKEKYGPWAFIAGGSEGIGASCAHLVAAEGMSVVLLARREGPLNQCADSIRQKYAVDVRVISADLSSPDFMEQVKAATNDIEIGLLLCATGSSERTTRFLDDSAENALNLVRRNSEAPLLLAHHFGQFMRQRKRGGMMFFTSMSGLAGASYQSTYGATKAFDHIFAESLWHELAPDGIDVMCLAVGATKTPSVARLGIDFSNLDPSKPDGGAMDPDDVAHEGLSHLGTTPLWGAGENNRAILSLLLSPDRVTAIETLSMGAAMVHGLEYKPVKQQPK